MPELPEVETVVRILRPQILNKKITDVRIFWNNTIKNITIAQLKKNIINKTIKSLDRIGKNIIFDLGSDVLISHLRMEGKYFVNKKNDKGDWKHILVVFELNKNEELRYHDTRRFGTMHLISKDEYLNVPPISKVGYEPFHPNMTPKYLYSKIKLKRIAIKTILLNQSIIAGLGNIYVNEVLFKSKIHPETPGFKITLKHCKLIIDYSIETLNEAIKDGGTTIHSFQASDGIDGKFTNKLMVHGRKGMPCYKCSNLILKIKVNQRGTYYCSNCQK